MGSCETPRLTVRLVLDVDGAGHVAAYGARVDEHLAVVLAPAPAAALVPAIAAAHDLTAREVDVLRLLLHGRSDRAIAAELVITPETAREHTGGVLRKLGLGRRAELPARLVPFYVDAGAPARSGGA